MLDRNGDTLLTRGSLLTLPIESRIEYTEKILDEVAKSIWGDAFSKGDKEKMESIAGRMLYSVEQIKGLALHILEEE